jgi:hypothetical protein
MWSEWALYTFINKPAYKGFCRWAEPIIHVTRGTEANIYVLNKELKIPKYFKCICKHYRILFFLFICEVHEEWGLGRAEIQGGSGYPDERAATRGGEYNKGE